MEGITQAEYARRRGVTRQTINEYVSDGRIALLPNGRIDPDAADKALDDIHKQRVTARDEPRTPGLASARAADAIYSARLRQLDYEARVGQLLPTKDVVRAMERCAEDMVRVIDRLPTYAEDLAVAYDRKGIAGLRAALRSAAREQREALAASMSLGDKDADPDT